MTRYLLDLDLGLFGNTYSSRQRRGDAVQGSAQVDKEVAPWRLRHHEGCCVPPPALCRAIWPKISQFSCK